MRLNITQKLNKLAYSRWYWLMYIAIGLGLLGVALVYQYVFDEMPCVMCIQLRLWVWLFTIVAILGLVTIDRRVLNAIAHVSIVLVAIGIAERSYKIFGTERGFIFGDCGFDTGLPAWFAVDQWLPWMFRVETSCGYTPELMFGITMAEALLVFSGVLLLLSLAVAWVSLARPKH